MFFARLLRRPQESLGRIKFRREKASAFCAKRRSRMQARRVAVGRCAAANVFADENLERRCVEGPAYPSTRSAAAKRGFSRSLHLLKQPPFSINPPCLALAFVKTWWAQHACSLFALNVPAGTLHSESSRALPWRAR